MIVRRTLIIGVGNVDRGDDGAGLAAAALLQERLSHRDDVDVIQHWGESTGLVDAMMDRDKVLIIDAAQSGTAPGRCRRIDVGAMALPSDLVDISSHGFGIPQAMELARALGTLPAHCSVYAIEGAAFEIGTPLSEPVQAAVEVVVEKIMRFLETSHA